MALTPDQLRAARALLNISQDDLAKGSGVAVTSIRQFELGTTAKLQQKTEAALLSFLGEKVEFIGLRGVALREDDHLILEGESAIALMFEDIRVHLSCQEAAEALFICGETPCLFSPQLAGHCAGLREFGVSYRSICHKKDASATRRVAPSNFAPLPLQAVYGATVAQMIGPNRIILLRSAMLAGGLRQTFELLWEALPASGVESEEENNMVRKRALRA